MANSLSLLLSLLTHGLSFLRADTSGFLGGLSCFLYIKDTVLARAYEEPSSGSR